MRMSCWGAARPCARNQRYKVKQKTCPQRDFILRDRNINYCFKMSVENFFLKGTHRMLQRCSGLNCDSQNYMPRTFGCGIISIKVLCRCNQGSRDEYILGLVRGPNPITRVLLRDRRGGDTGTGEGALWRGRKKLESRCHERGTPEAAGRWKRQERIFP